LVTSPHRAEGRQEVVVLKHRAGLTDDSAVNPEPTETADVVRPFRSAAERRARLRHPSNWKPVSWHGDELAEVLHGPWSQQ
jgi:hypothetical protein